MKNMQLDKVNEQRVLLIEKLALLTSKSRSFLLATTSSAAIMIKLFMLRVEGQ